MLNNEWVGVKVKRKSDGLIGKIITDRNGIFRILTIEFPDNTKKEIWLSNFGPENERLKKENEQYMFQGIRNPHKWYEF